jgi:hypothetical protein
MSGNGEVIAEWGWPLPKPEPLTEDSAVGALRIPPMPSERYTTPEAIKAYIQEDYASNRYEFQYDALSQDIDRMLFGYSTVEAERLRNRLIDSSEIEQRYPDQKLWLRGSEAFWTSYLHVKKALRNLELTEGETLYDLGSGHGRFLIYGAIVCEATFKGIEIMPDRTASTRHAAARLALNNVEVKEGSVLEQDFSDGDAFYMYTPFTWPVFEAVLNKLRVLAEIKHIRLVTRGCGGSVWTKAYPEGWLRKVPFQSFGLAPSIGLDIFESC